MPFSGMRVICADPPVDASAATETEHDSSDCARLCTVHRPAASATGSDCSLTADASSLIVVAGVSVLPVQMSLHMPVVVSDAGTEPQQLYAEPGLAHLSPPPKA